MPLHTIVVEFHVEADDRASAESALAARLPVPLQRERLEQYTGHPTNENITSPVTAWDIRSEDDNLERATCGCGSQIVNTPDGWQHNVAPYLWGDDHDAHPATS